MVTCWPSGFGSAMSFWLRYSAQSKILVDQQFWTLETEKAPAVNMKGLGICSDAATTVGSLILAL